MRARCIRLGARLGRTRCFGAALGSRVPVAVAVVAARPGRARGAMSIALRVVSMAARRRVPVAALALAPMPVPIRVAMSPRGALVLALALALLALLVAVERRMRRTGRPDGDIRVLALLVARGEEAAVTTAVAVAARRGVWIARKTFPLRCTILGRATAIATLPVVAASVKVSTATRAAPATTVAGVGAVAVVAPSCTPAVGTRRRHPSVGLGSGSPPLRMCERPRWRRRHAGRRRFSVVGG